MEFLCECVRPGGGATVAGKTLDWPRVWALATHHHVVPLVYRSLREAAERSEPVPEEFLAGLRRQAAAIAAHNLRAAGILRRLQGLLADGGIRVAPVKGPVLAVLAYGRLALRQFEDLDLIVHPAETLRAVALLEREGYLAGELPARACRGRFAASLQDWSLRKRGDLLHLDLKPVLITHTMCDPASAEYVLSDCRPVPLGEGHEIEAPGAPAMLLAVCIDGANEAWPKLSAVADAGALLVAAPGMDWAKWLDDAARLGNRRSALVGVQVAEILLGISLPEALRQAADRDPASRRLAREAAERLRRGNSLQAGFPARAGFASRSRDGGRSRARYWRRLLFVPGAADLHMFALPDALHGVYSFLRPFRLAWDALRGRSRRLGLVEPGAGEP